ncbi:MAG: ATP-binding cassette domain-containing protein [Turicibacter sp.]|nr:ATP-binding cassette domain-containing protein [Turicibacter sp.]
MLKISNLQLTFGKGSVNQNHVLKGVDLIVNEGDFITVIGGNGAGKSTLLNSIAGSLAVDEGAIEIGGIDVTSRSEHQRASLLGRVFQDPRLGTATRMTIEENMKVALKRGQKRGLKFGISRTDRILFAKHLEQLELGLEKRLKAEVGLLSGGQRQALTLLMATLVQPKILLLDEHTAALDPKTAEQVLKLTDKIVTEQNLTAFMITHNMQDALTYGNRLIMLDKGKIIVDLSKEEKERATVEDLMRLFKERSGSVLNDEALLT